MSTTLSPDAERADTAYFEQVAEQWRDWRRYLAAHRDLLAARAASSSERGAFERAGAGADEPSAKAEQVLAALPPARRTIFDAEREARRQKAQAEAERAARASGTAALPDPGVLERTVIAQLLSEATGAADEAEGRGLVPMGDGHWYSVDVAALEDAPNAAAYSLRRSQTDERRKRLLLIAALLLCGLGVTAIWFLWPAGRATATVVSTIVVNGTSVPAWPLRELILEPVSGSAYTSVVTATAASNWPPTHAEGAWWREGSAWPLELCLPRAELARGRALELVSDELHPIRRYTLEEGTSEGPDIRVTACDDPKIAPRAGHLANIEPLDELPFASSQEVLPDQRLTVKRISSVGQGEDATLPAGQVWVSVAVSTTQPLDWPALEPTLRLVSGEVRQPSEVAQSADGATLHYLVPAYQSPLAVAWSVVSPNGVLFRWRTTLAVPPARDAVLRAALRIVDAHVHASEAGGPELVLVIANRGASPVQLQVQDVMLSIGGATVPTPDLPDLRAPLAPGEQRPIALPLAGLASRQPLVVQLGAERMQVRFL